MENKTANTNWKFIQKGFRILVINLLLLVAGIVNGQSTEPKRDVTTLSEYVGAYRVSAAEIMTICRFQHGGRELFLFTDYAAGWRGTMQPASLNTYDVLERDQTLRPADPKIVLGKTGDSLNIRLVLPNGKSRIGTTRPNPFGFGHAASRRIPDPQDPPLPRRDS